jgi:hypothetical protein
MSLKERANWACVPEDNNKPIRSRVSAGNLHVKRGELFFIKYGS